MGFWEDLRDRLRTANEGEPQQPPQLPEITEPGTLPIPEGSVRLFHATDPKNVASIREHGLSHQFAKGNRYGEPNFVWATPTYGSYGNPEHHAYAEFHVPKEWISDRGKNYAAIPPEHLDEALKKSPHFAFNVDIPKENIVAIHEPKHHMARKMIDYEKDGDLLPQDYATWQQQFPEAFEIAKQHFKHYRGQ